VKLAGLLAAAGVALLLAASADARQIVGTRRADLLLGTTKADRIASSDGAMVGDYISSSFAGGRAVGVFTLAQSRLHGKLRQATYAASVAVP
jgi:hypothetical protein